MQKLLQFFITAKHWQVFLILFGVPFIGQFLVMGMMMAIFMGVAITEENPSPDQMATAMTLFMIPFGLVLAVFMGFFLTWFWALGKFCNQQIREAAIRPGMGLFKFTLILPFFHIFAFTAVFVAAMTHPENPLALLLIFPLHFLAVFCMFYNLYFVSKNLTLAQKQQPVRISDYALNFVLIWFYPVGIWIIQPQLNELYHQSQSDSPPPIPT